MTTIPISDLIDLALLMKKQGITRLKVKDVEIDMPLVRIPEVADEDAPVAESRPEVKKRPGADGLTSEEQIDLYGRTIDAE